MPATYSAAAVPITLKIIESYGIDPMPLMEQAGIDAELVGDPWARLPYRQIDDLWYLAQEKTQDPAFGLRAARFWHPSHLGALGFAWLASRSLRTALERMARFSRLLTEGARMVLEEDGETLSLVLSYEDFSRKQATRTDSFMAMLLAMCRANCGDGFHPNRICLTHPEPEDTGPFYALFHCPIQFSAPDNRFCVDLADADRPLSTANPLLEQINDRLMIGALAKLEQDDIVEKVKVEIIRQLPSGRISDDKVAEALNMHVRTLQRRLQEKETTFKSLMVEVRRELAEAYLRNNQLSLQEISFLLGFSDMSAFTHAFKRWTGKPPSHFRREAIG